MERHSAQRVSDNGFARTMRPTEVDALRLLLEVTGFVEGAAKQHWQSALGRHDLVAAGVNDAVVRRLLRQGLVEHRVEKTRPGARRRTFRPGGAALEERSCFVLSDLGRERALAALAADNGGRDTLDARRKRRVKPHWDAAQGYLMVGSQVLRHYRPQAHNRITLLAAFEEWKWQWWPQWLDDPLPGKGDVDRQRRLYEAVVALNRDQEPQLVEFLTHQNKTAVAWRWREELSGPTGEQRSSQAAEKSVRTP